MRFLASVVLLAATLTLAGIAQRSTPPAAEWPTYNHDLAGTRFSPLAQIDAGNVAKLVQAWTYRFPVPPGRGGAPAAALGGSEAVPIVVGGIMYLPASNTVVALEADTGKLVWQREVAGAGPGGGLNRRGVAYWPGDSNTPDRIFATAGRRLLSFDAATGKPSEGFGTNGEVDMVIGYGAAPTIYKNVLMVGAAVNEVPIGPPGDTRAFDAVTGKKLWEFHTVPRKGEFGNDTWGDGWEGRSGTNIWGFSMTVDEARGIVYMPVAGPAANYYGGDRPGNNLFGNSIVAVDIATGKYKWHFQTVHHDIWDIDMSAPPGLVDIKLNGRTIPALAQVGKSGYMFILDRVTGKPVFGVEERPVPKGNVPGEWYSPTQPFPVKPPPLAKVSFKKEDMVTAADTTPEHAQACQELWDRSGGFTNDGPFTPFTFHEDGAPPKSTISFPGGTGGVNWGGSATDPRTGFVFMNSHDTSLVGWVEKKKPGVTYSFDTAGSPPGGYDRASVDGVGPFHTFSAPIKDANGKTLTSLPCQRPPWARLIAVNANTGEIAWQTTLGITEELPPGKQNTGGSGSAGPTVTAGGLVFIGATNDRRFRAFDSKTGREIWTTKLDKAATANPITYQGKNGKQYVAIVAGDAVVVFALP
jgi:quinoprotein glucose dehydrogenase